MTAFERPKGSGRWVAKFTLDGEQHWVKGAPWPTKRQAQEAERRYRDRLRFRRSDETCASFTDRWLKEWPRPETSTQRLYAASVKRFAEHFGPTRLDEVEILSARTWALTVSRKTTSVVRTMFEDARSVGLVGENPFANLRLPVTEKKGTIEPPSLEDYRTLLSATSILGGYGPEFKAMIQFAAWTGIRQGELFALQWDDIDGDQMTVRRSRKVDGGLGLPKNGWARTIDILPPAQVLEEVPRRHNSPFVFHSPHGKALIRGTFGWSWQKVKANAEIKCRWHDLRHFCATRLLELGLDHFAVSIQLGHRDGGALVMSRYGHPSVDAARKRLVAAFEMSDDEAGSGISNREAM